MVALLAALTACEDDYETMFEVFPANGLKQDSSIPVSELFPGEWDTICVVKPGDKPVVTINAFLPDFNAAGCRIGGFRTTIFPMGFSRSS